MKRQDKSRCTAAGNENACLRRGCTNRRHSYRGRVSLVFQVSHDREDSRRAPPPAVCFYRKTWQREANKHINNTMHFLFLGLLLPLRASTLSERDSSPRVGDCRGGEKSCAPGKARFFSHGQEGIATSVSLLRAVAPRVQQSR